MASSLFKVEKFPEPKPTDWRMVAFGTKAPPPPPPKPVPLEEKEFMVEGEMTKVRGVFVLFWRKGRVFLETFVVHKDEEDEVSMFIINSPLLLLKTKSYSQKTQKKNLPRCLLSEISSI